MPKSDPETRARIVDAAAGLFAEHGFSGTKVGMVAKAAGVTSGTVRRLTGGRAELFEEVMVSRVTSSAAERLASAVEDPGATPPIAVILQAAQEVFANPASSWDVLELEALTRAHLDDKLREIESARMRRRWDNTAALVAQIRAGGGLDADVSDRAVVQLAIAMSAGLALLDPVVETKPTMLQWISLIARIGTAISPQEQLLAPEYEERQPWRVRVDISEQVGSVARLVRALASLHSHVVGLQVVERQEGTRTIDVALTAPVSVGGESLKAAALSVGRHAFVGEGSPDDGLDIPTRVLDGAAALVKAPEWTPVAAAELVEADEVEVTGATEGEDDSPDVLRLQWTPDQHVVLQRSWAPFARAERTRASALLRLSSAIARVTGGEETGGWVEPIKGGTVWIRLARPEDADAVAAMHDRSSERSRYQRYFSIADWHGTRLYRLAGGHRGATLVVMSEDGSIIGLGNLFPDPDEGHHAAEIAMIVEDAYQGRGVGRILMQAMLHLASRLGFTEVVASVLADNNGMLHVLKSSGLNWTTSVHDGVASMRAPLPTPLVTPVLEVENRPVERAARKKAPGKAATAKAPAENAAGETTAKETPAEKTPAEKTPAKKTPAKKAAAKRAPAKKAPAKKASAKKAAAKKTSARKAPARRAASKKAPQKKTAAREALPIGE